MRRGSIEEITERFFTGLGSGGRSVCYKNDPCSASDGDCLSLCAGSDTLHDPEFYEIHNGGCRS